VNLTLSYLQIKKVNNIVLSIQKRYGGVIPLLVLILIIASALRAAGGVASGVASAVSALNNARAAAIAQAELERNNREVEDHLKAGSGLISDYVGKRPMIGNILKPLLQKLDLGIDDYNIIIKGGCVRCGKGLYLKPYGSGLYIGPKI